MGAEGVADEHDARPQRDLGAAQRVRIATAVPVLVRGADDPCHRSQRGNAVEDALPDDRVLSHQPPVVVIELPWLVQHRIRSRDLSNVVKLGRSVQLVELLGIHAQLTADGDGQVRHLANVVTELRLTLLQCLHEHVSCLRRDGRPVEQPVGPVSEGVVVRLEAVEIEERPGRVGLACPAVHEGSHGASFGITAYRALATRQQLALGANNRSFAQPSTVPRRTMEFRILGLIDVRNEAGAVALGGKKPRAVLAVLLLHANEPVSAERLALALWGEDAPGGAVKTVQVHVSRLRRALGDPGIVATTAGGYRLRVRPGRA